MPPRQRRPDLDIPADVEAVCLRALEKDRDKRWPDMDAFYRALGAAGGVPFEPSNVFMPTAGVAEVSGARRSRTPRRAQSKTAISVSPPRPGRSRTSGPSAPRRPPAARAPGAKLGARRGGGRRGGHRPGAGVAAGGRKTAADASQRPRPAPQSRAAAAAPRSRRRAGGRDPADADRRRRPPPPAAAARAGRAPRPRRRQAATARAARASATSPSRRAPRPRPIRSTADRRAGASDARRAQEPVRHAVGARSPCAVIPSRSAPRPRPRTPRALVVDLHNDVAHQAHALAVRLHARHGPGDVLQPAAPGSRSAAHQARRHRRARLPDVRRASGSIRGGGASGGSSSARARLARAARRHARRSRATPARSAPRARRDGSRCSWASRGATRSTTTSSAGVARLAEARRALPRARCGSATAAPARPAARRPRATRASPTRARPGARLQRRRHPASTSRTRAGRPSGTCIERSATAAVLVALGRGRRPPAPAQPRRRSDPRLAARGGIVGVIFVSPYLGGTVLHARARRRSHRARGAQVGGEDCVALGSDFDGFLPLPRGLRDAADLPRLTELLWRRGWRGPRLGKLLGENALRYFEATVSAANDNVARRRGARRRPRPSVA